MDKTGSRAKRAEQSIEREEWTGVGGKPWFKATKRTEARAVQWKQCIRNVSKACGAREPNSDIVGNGYPGPLERATPSGSRQTPLRTVQAADAKRKSLKEGLEEVMQKLGKHMLICAK
jgi:hypothetical protein